MTDRQRLRRVRDMLADYFASDYYVSGNDTGEVASIHRKVWELVYGEDARQPVDKARAFGMLVEWLRQASSDFYDVILQAWVESLEQQLDADGSLTDREWMLYTVGVKVLSMWYSAMLAREYQEGADDVEERLVREYQGDTADASHYDSFFAHPTNSFGASLE